MPDSSLNDLFETQEDENPAKVSRARGRRAVKRAKKPNLFSRFFPMLLVLLALGGLGYAAVFGYNWVTQNISLISEPNDYEGEGTSEVIIQIQEGDLGSDIANTLVENGVIKSQAPFIAAFSANPDAASIQAGSYALRLEMSSAAALRTLLDPESRVGIRVTFPEGQTTWVMYERLSEATGIPVADFEAAAEDYLALGVPENPAKSVEGYLFPGTYDFQEDQTATQILTQMVERMKQVLEAKEIAPEQWHEVLTYASIAEKEARNTVDYAKVVRTLHNRLDGIGEAGGRAMNLELDSTIAYFHRLDSVETTPEQRSVDNPYNTYLHPGLPIGPIANPGEATIDAALSPADGPWLYWVTVNPETGETLFSETFAQHQENIEIWRENARKSG